jgi:hypothetical protein
MSDITRYRDTYKNLRTRLANTTLFEQAPFMDTETAP